MYSLDNIGGYISSLTAYTTQEKHEYAKILSHLMTRMLQENHEWENMVIQPLEKQITLKPDILNENELLLPRKRIQKKYGSKMKQAITIAVDAGIALDSSLNEQAAHMQISGIILTQNKVYISKNLILYPPAPKRGQLNLMGAAELYGLACMISVLTESKKLCTNYELEEHGLTEETCPCQAITKMKKENPELMNKITTENPDIYVLVDRPLIPYYVYGMRHRSRNRFIDAYQEFYQQSMKNNVIAYSVTTSSSQKNIYELLARALTSDAPFQVQNVLIKALQTWLEENKYKQDTAIHDLEAINVQLTDTEYQTLIQYLDDIPEYIAMTSYMTTDPTTQTPQNIMNYVYNIIYNKQYLTDYDILQPLFTRFEERSNAWQLNNEPNKTKENSPYKFFATHYPNVTLNFFYVNYGYSWARIETTSTRIPEIYKNYLFMTSFTQANYPIVLELAHHHAVINGSLRKFITKYNQKVFQTFQSNKQRSKQHLKSMWRG